MSSDRDNTHISPGLTRSPTERTLAIVNGGLAGVAMVIVCAMPILLLLMMFGGGGGGGGGPGWGGIGVGMAMGTLISSFMVSMVTVVPLCVWLLLIAKWLWRGDSRGRQQLLWLAWITAGATLLFGVYAWFGLREPLQYAFFGLLPAIYSAFHLVVLAPSRQSYTVSTLLVGSVVLSFVAIFAGQKAFANPGRIPSEISTHFGATLLTTGHVVCIGSDLSSSSREDVIMVWDFKTGKNTLRKSFPQMLKYDFSVTSHLLAALDESKVASGGTSDVFVCELPGGEQRARVLNVIKRGGCQALKLSPRGDFLAVAWGQGMVDLYTLPAGKLQRSFHAEKRITHLVHHLAFDPKGEFLAVGAAQDGTVANVALWPVAGAAETPQWQLSTGHLMGLSFSAESTRIIMVTHAELLSVDVKTGKVLARFPHPPRDPFAICASGFSSDGKQFGLVQADGEVNIWDTDTGKINLTISVGPKVSHDSAAMNLDSMLLVVGPSSPSVVWLRRWDIASQSELTEFK